MSTKSKKIALDSLRSAFDKVYVATDTLDGKLQNILNYSSVIISVALAVMASALFDKVGIVFWIILLAILVLYIINFLIILKELTPTDFSLPISNDLDELKKQYYETSEEFAIKQSILDYTTFIQPLLHSLDRKGKAIKISYMIIAAITILLIISVPLGLIFVKPNISCFFHTVNCVIGKSHLKYLSH
jgi:hypothetical protein